MRAAATMVARRVAATAARAEAAKKAPDEAKPYRVA
jgi:hypothetical protein